MVDPDGHRLTVGACIVISSPWGSPYPPCQIPKLPAASSDFMLQVTPEEAETLRLQIATSTGNGAGDAISHMRSPSRASPCCLESSTVGVPSESMSRSCERS